MSKLKMILFNNYNNNMCLIILFSALILIINYANCSIGNMFDLKYWRCVMKKTTKCPDNDIKFYLYNHEMGLKKQRIDTRNHLALKYSAFDPDKKNVIIVHGFNGTEHKTPMTILRDAYLDRLDYNIFMVDWEPLTKFPCYLSALQNTMLVAQCTAYLYAFIMDNGGNAYKTTCIGHSLGAHICGMISNHLDVRQHKIVGLDPAKPLVSRYASRQFRLTRDDADHVQVIHTNAGFLGEKNQIGHVDFCVNGGRQQPGCKGHKLRRARCSHFQSVCYFAATVRNSTSITAVPCSESCPKGRFAKQIYDGGKIFMGFGTPFNARGSYCASTYQTTDCPFN